MSILGYTAVQAVSEPSTHPLDLTTPRPQYSAEPPLHSPQRLASHEQMRALAAMRHARVRYPGVAGEVLAEAIAAWKELGYLGQPSAPVRRLIEELMKPC